MSFISRAKRGLRPRDGCCAFPSDGLLYSLALGAMFAFIIGCGSSYRTTASRPARAACDQRVLTVAFDEPTELSTVLVYDSADRLVAELTAAGSRRQFDFPWPPVPAGGFRLELRLVDGSRQTVPLEVRPQAAVRIELELPAGQDPQAVEHDARLAALVPRAGTWPLGLTVQLTRQQRTEFTLSLEADWDGAWNDAGPAWRRVSPRSIELADTLEVEFDDRPLRLPLRLPAAALRQEENHAAAGAVRRIAGTLRSWTTDRQAADEQRFVVELTPIDRQLLAGQLQFEPVVFPADPLGQRRAEQLADTVVLPNPLWNRLRIALRAESSLFNFYDAYAYQAVTIRSTAQAPVNLLLESTVIDAATGQPLETFAPPVWKSPRSSATTETLVRVVPQQATVVRWPLYVRPEVQPGRYLRQFRVYWLGESQPLAAWTAGLEVRRGNPWVSGVVLGSLLVALAGWIIAAVWGRRLLAHLPLEGLATIALVASLHFAVSFAARLSGDLLSALLGPLAVFVAGIGHEAATSLLLAVAIVLWPRPLTLALSSLTVFLLNALFSGQLGLVDLLFVSVSMTLGEAALAIGGVTTGSSWSRPAAAATTRQVWQLALALGLANVATLYAQFCLIQVLHRLYFASWYIASVALVTGLGYGALGAAWGTRLGFRLRRSVR